MLALLVSTALAAPDLTVQVDPLTALLGFAHVQVETVLSPRTSLYVGPNLRLYSAPWAEPEPFRGYGLEAGFRVYPWGAAPKGPYALVRGTGAWLRTNDGQHQKFGGYASALGGYQAILGERFVLSGALGVNLLRYDIDGMGTRGVLPAAHTAIGIKI